MKAWKIVPIVALSISVCLAGLLIVFCSGIWRLPAIILAELAPSPTMTAGEQATLSRLAASWGTAAEWEAVYDYLNYQLIPLGMSRDQVHEHLQEIGPFSITRSDVYVNGAGIMVLDETLVFDDPVIRTRLDDRIYKYDISTYQVVEVQVGFVPGGDTARILPPPP